MPSKSELQNLLRKMGGTPESGDSVDETIKKISEVYEPGGGGGSGLPEGGSAGQIVKKKSSAEGDAEWAADENDIFVVNLESGAVGGSYIVTNTTYDEIENAITVDKKYVVAILYRGQQLFTLYKYINNVGIFLQSSEITIDNRDNKTYSSDIIKIYKSNNDQTLCQKDTSISTYFNVVERDDVYKTPYIMRLLCDGDYSYKDNPSGVLSLDCPNSVGAGKNEYYISNLRDLCYTWLQPDINYFYLGKFNGICKICYGTFELTDNNSSEKVEYYDLVSIDSEPSIKPTYEEADLKITATFRTISSRGNSIVIKTITLSDNYSSIDPTSMNSLVPVYSEKVIS